MKIIISVGGAAVALVGVAAIAYAKGVQDGKEMSNHLDDPKERARLRAELRALLEEGNGKKLEGEKKEDREKTT